MRASRLALLLFISTGLSFTDKRYSYKNLYNYFSKYQGSVRVLLSRLIVTGEIEKMTINNRVHFVLTTYGREKLKALLAMDYAQRKWDKKWRLLLTAKQNNKIQKYGLGKLQNSVYITPFPIEKYDLDLGYLVVVKQIFPLENRALAQHVWRLNTLLKRYDTWILKAQGAKIAHIDGLISEYAHIVREDPKLPKELLVSDWPFERARDLLLRLIRLHFGSPPD